MLVLAVHYTETFDPDEIAQVLGNWIEMLPKQFRTFTVDRDQPGMEQLIVEQAVACTFIPTSTVETEH